MVPLQPQTRTKLLKRTGFTAQVRLTAWSRTSLVGACDHKKYMQSRATPRSASERQLSHVIKVRWQRQGWTLCAVAQIEDKSVLLGPSTASNDTPGRLVYRSVCKELRTQLTGCKANTLTCLTSCFVQFVQHRSIQPSCVDADGIACSINLLVWHHTL